jgi:hypothetical protein
MAIEKGLYAAPLGMEVEEEPTFEFEVMLTDEEMGDEEEVEVVPFDANLAEHLEEDVLTKIATDLMGLVEADQQSRKDWAENFVEGLDVLGMKYEERTQPWTGACGVHSSVLSEAVIRFQAESMSETFPAAGPVKTKVIGLEDKEKLEAAERVREDMNYQLTERMIEYRPEHERMLYSLGVYGSAFKKVYFCPKLDRQTSVFVTAEDIIVPYGASHIWSAERVTHIMRKTENEVAQLQEMGFYCKCDLGEPEPFHSDIEEKKAEDAGFTLNEDNRFAIFEIHVDMVMPEVDEEDALASPYVVTIEKGTNKVLAIRRNWDEMNEKKEKNQYFVHYVYIPGFGFYGMGLLHIIGGYARAGTSLIRQLVDAGTLSNLPGGLKTRDLRNLGDNTPIGPGEWRDVDVPSGAIRDNIMALPYKEPSPTLLSLLERITDEGRRLGAISDMNISDMSAQAPVGTTLALLERTLKPMAAVQARVHYAMKQEFKLLKKIIAEFADRDYDYTPASGIAQARKSDYEMVEVIPVSDPNSSTMAQRIVQYQAAMQLAKDAPQIYDLPQLHRQMIEVLGIKNAEKLIPLADDALPVDPMSENMAALVGKPMKVFIEQDHQAHMAAHSAFMQDPMIMQAIGQNPQAQQIMASLQAHIAEHVGFAYRTQMEQKLGAPLPPPNQPLPPEAATLLARLMAEAGQQLAQQHQQEAAQKQAQQQMQDPNLKLQMQAEETKRMEVERKAAKDQADAKLRADEQQRKRAKDVVDAELTLEELAAKNNELAVQAMQSREQLTAERADLDKRTSIETLKALSSMIQPPTTPKEPE